MSCLAAGVSRRPTLVRVDLGAVADNYRFLERRAAPARVCAVVKADAYGHGMIPVARALERAGCGFFAVSSLEEGIELREGGVGSPALLLFGLDPAGVACAVSRSLTPVVGSLGDLAALEEAARSCGATLDVHLDFDTGMSRMGLFPEEAGPASDLLLRGKSLRLAGVATHFARAGEDAAFTSLQARRFEGVLATLAARGLDPGFVHAANSAACLAHPETRYHGVRAGIALYGVAPEDGMPEAGGLRPALEWVTSVMLLRELPAGTPLSYGGKFTTARPSRIATLPVGYADGYRRALGAGGGGEVIVRGRLAPVVGRVCMDLTLVDVTDVEGVAQGDEAVLLGHRGFCEIGAADMARRLGTIGYEVLCGIGKRVPRVYKEF